MPHQFVKDLKLIGAGKFFRSHFTAKSLRCPPDVPANIMKHAEACKNAAIVCSKV
jgi:hypothetical protein